MSVELNYATALSVDETLDANTVSAAAKNRVVKHTSLNKAAKLTATSTPPATKVAAFQQLLTAGAASIDLTALVGTNAAVVTGLGLKVQAIKVAALTTNENPLTIATGAANGYALGGADFSVALQPGQEFVMFGNDATPDIAADAKTLDLAGTGTEGVNVIVVMG